MVLVVKWRDVLCRSWKNTLLSLIKYVNPVTVEYRSLRFRCVDWGGVPLLPDRQDLWGAQLWPRQCWGQHSGACWWGGRPRWGICGCGGQHSSTPLPISTHCLKAFHCSWAAHEAQCVQTAAPLAHTSHCVAQAQATLTSSWNIFPRVTTTTTLQFCATGASLCRPCRRSWSENCSDWNHYLILTNTPSNVSSEISCVHFIYIHLQFDLPSSFSFTLVALP